MKLLQISLQFWVCPIETHCFVMKLSGLCHIFQIWIHFTSDTMLKNDVHVFCTLYVHFIDMLGYRYMMMMCTLQDTK